MCQEVRNVGKSRCLLAQDTEQRYRVGVGTGICLRLGGSAFSIDRRLLNTRESKLAGIHGQLILRSSCQQLDVYKFRQSCWIERRTIIEARKRKQQHDDSMQCGRDRDGSEGTIGS